MNDYRQSLLEKASQGLLQVRDMTDSDLNQVIAIEQNAHLSPWARLSFEESLTRSQTSESSSCRVLHVEAEIVAYHVVSSVLDELHILNVVSAPQAQGIGLGHRLMQDIVEFAQAHCLKKLFLEVRASNHVAQSLYQKWQFEQIAIRKQYYRPAVAKETKEDAFVYLRQL